MTKILTKLDIEQIKSKYLSGTNIPELATDYGISNDAIKYHLRKENFTIRRTYQLLDGVAIAKDYLSGINSPELSIKYNVSKEAILYHLKKQGVPARKPFPIEDEDEYEIISLYNKGNSTIEIGKLFGSSHRRISGILKTHGVKLRTKREALAKHARYNICVACGKSFRAKASYNGRGGHSRKTCSPECYKHWHVPWNKGKKGEYHLPVEPDRGKKISKGKKKSVYRHSEETKLKLREANLGDKCHWWKDGSSFEPYCYKFNNPRKRATRNFFGNYCICCGKHVTENIVGKKQIEMTVHHSDHDKDQGCNGVPFNLVVLCHNCHSKELHHQEEYQQYINKTLREGFKWGIWNEEEYIEKVMYDE